MLDKLALEYAVAAENALQRGQSTVTIRGTIRSPRGTQTVQLCSVQSETLANAADIGTFACVVLQKIHHIQARNRRLSVEPEQVLDSTNPEGVWLKAIGTLRMELPT
jgi:hypothetical protein